MRVNNGHQVGNLSRVKGAAVPTHFMGGATNHQVHTKISFPTMSLSAGMLPSAPLRPLFSARTTST